jgi:hypothetical protein
MGGSGDSAFHGKLQGHNKTLNPYLHVPILGPAFASHSRPS